MYNYYCTFGEKKQPGTDFMSKITNILREALEGILTNSEVAFIYMFNPQRFKILTTIILLIFVILLTDNRCSTEI